MRTGGGLNWNRWPRRVDRLPLRNQGAVGRWLGLALTVLLVTSMTTSSCGGDRSSPAVDESLRACEAESGAATDIASEPHAWRFPEYRDWGDRHGCLVRIDVLTDRSGPAHCGYESARVIVAGAPIGTPFTEPADSVQYVRDPDGAFGVPRLTVGLQLDTVLPAEAVDTGFRQAETELWVVPDDPRFIYLKNGNRAERWPAGEAPLCA